MSISWIEHTCEWLKALRDCKHESTRIFMEIASEWASKEHRCSSYTTFEYHGALKNKGTSTNYAFKLNDNWIGYSDGIYWISGSLFGNFMIYRDSLVDCCLAAFAFKLHKISLFPPLTDDELKRLDLILLALKQVNTLGLPVDLLDKAAIWLENNTKIETTKL